MDKIDYVKKVTDNLDEVRRVLVDVAKMCESIECHICPFRLLDEGGYSYCSLASSDSFLPLDWKI